MPKTYRVVQAGCGGMGQQWLKVLKASPRVELVGLVDLSREALDKSVAKHELTKVATGTDLADMLAKTKPDFVVDVTLPEAHHQVLLTAVRAGCHVIGEKPLADSMAHAREMVAAAQAAGKVYMISQNRRWIAAVRAIRQALADGLLGTVSTINADFYIGAHFGGFRDQMDHPLTLDMSIHHFDMLRCMTQTDPVAVYCHEFNPTGSWYKGDVACSAIFEMTGGQVFTYRGSWCAEGHNTSWESEWRFIGEKGTLLWDGRKAPVVELAVPTPGKFTNPVERKELPVTEPGPFGQEGALKEFLAAIEDGRQPEAWCGDNIKSLAMVFGAVESNARKMRVEIEA